jgi:hypothetical protein
MCPLLVRLHPGLYAGASAVRFHSGGKKFFILGNYEVHDIDSAYKNYRTLQTWPLLPFGIISALGIVGLGLARKKFREAFLLYAMIVVYLFSALVFFVASRYRLPAAPFLAIFAACTVTSLYTQLRERRRIRLLACAGLVAARLPVRISFSGEIEDPRPMAESHKNSLQPGRNMLFKKGPTAPSRIRQSHGAGPGFAPPQRWECHAVLNDFSR